MYSREKTEDVVYKFFAECARYWMRNGLDEFEACRYACKDIKNFNLEYDPNYPWASEDHKLDPVGLNNAKKYCLRDTYNKHWRDHIDEIGYKEEGRC